jgi:hypothetical protein
LDTGQLLTYLYILLLPVIVLNLIRLAYPTKFVAKVITKSAPWRLQGRSHAICCTRVKRYKIPEQKLRLLLPEDFFLRLLLLGCYFFQALLL